MDEDAAPATVLKINGVIARLDIPLLCDRLTALLEDAAAGTLICDVAGLIDEDVATVDALARLQLLARRRGRALRIRHASAALRDLLLLTGLFSALQLEPGLPVEMQGQAEKREEPRGVQEERDTADGPA